MAEHKEYQWLMQHYIRTYQCRVCEETCVLETYFWNNTDNCQPSTKTLTKLKEHLILKHPETYVRLKDLSQNELLRCYNSKLNCQVCIAGFENNTYSFQPSKEILIQLKRHLCDNHTKQYNPKHDTEYNVIKVKQVPVRSFILKHYSYLKGNLLKCNNCFQIFCIAGVNVSSYKILYFHLKHDHYNKLTAVERDDSKVAWYWDYFTQNKGQNESKICEKKYNTSTNHNHLGSHLINVHKKTYPTLSIATDDTEDSIDTDMRTSTGKENVQETAASLCTDMPTKTEVTRALNEPTASTSKAT
ncbi:PREDICTED: uncharacterized protein LOC105560051 [Vollenhovia emeryi]|uniref:uncharacterized protein LOC105560051 n=1 Tax=Vollenhovia emeryi TaxID=411798 RepID=UPI0005F3659A|nr:PREDICTED: uncharacterized protein LOC105560051 [Vollenhovia emeryi]